MKSRQEELRDRTKRFAVQMVFFFRTLPKTEDARIIGKQVLRSATSVAANYRAACLSRSKGEFIARMGIVVEEADETVFWLELLEETNIAGGEQIHSLIAEAKQLAAIFGASLRTARASRNNPIAK